MENKMIVEKLSKNQLIGLVNGLLYSAQPIASEEDFDRRLLTFCLNCPDPGGAMDLIIEAPQGSSPNEIVEISLKMTPRDVNSYSEDELALDHELRYWKLEN